MKWREFTKLSNICSFFWLWSDRGGRKPSQNTLLRPIHGALGLRHPWLRTVLGGLSPTAITPKPEKRTNVRKFRKFPPFHEPVTEDQALSVRSYTKIVINIPQKMLS